MKVIVEIVNYLYGKGVLDDEDRLYLKEKGIYPKWEYDYYEYMLDYNSLTVDDLDEEEFDKNRTEEEFIKLEKNLENKRPVTRKPKRRFKKKKLAPKHAKEKIVKETLGSIENISWRPPLIINTHDNDLEALINNYFFHEKITGSRKGIFTDIGLFWDWAIQNNEWETAKEDTMKTFIAFSEEIINRMESRMEKQKYKRTDDYIRPAAFFELLEIPEVIRDRWSLRVQLRDGHQLQITDKEGRFIFER